MSNDSSSRHPLITFVTVHVHTCLRCHSGVCVLRIYSLTWPDLFVLTVCSQSPDVCGCTRVSNHVRQHVYYLLKYSLLTITMCLFCSFRGSEDTPCRDRLGRYHCEIKISECTNYLWIMSDCYLQSWSVRTQRWFCHCPSPPWVTSTWQSCSSTAPPVPSPTTAHTWPHASPWMAAEPSAW